jgi:hypothetical protein
MNLPVLPQSQPGGHLADRERRASRLSNQTPPQLPAVLTDLKHSLRHESKPVRVKMRM